MSDVEPDVPFVPCDGEWEEFEVDGVTYCAHAHISGTDEACPTGFGDRKQSDGGFVVCDDTPGGDNSIKIAAEYYRERCAAIDNEDDCDCVWVEAERHFFRDDNGQCQPTDQGRCVFLHDEYGLQVTCLIQSVDGGEEGIFLGNGYGLTPGWMTDPLGVPGNICDECGQ